MSGIDGLFDFDFVGTAGTTLTAGHIIRAKYRLEAEAGVPRPPVQVCQFCAFVWAESEPQRCPICLALFLPCPALDGALN